MKPEKRPGHLSHDRHERTDEAYLAWRSDGDYLATGAKFGLMSVGAGLGMMLFAWPISRINSTVAEYARYAGMGALTVGILLVTVTVLAAFQLPPTPPPPEDGSE